jgi:hypothetical protein
MCKEKGTPRFRLVEVEVSSTSQQDFSLKDEEVLRDAKRIIAIEAYKVGTLALSPTGRAVVNDTVFKKSFLIIGTADSDEVLNKIPLSDLSRADNNGQLFYVDIPPVAPSKCSIKVATVATLSASESFVLAFHYEM